MSAAAVAAQLGVTPAAVRRHLETLTDEGFVAPRYQSTTGRRGRPARVFVVTGRGHGEARNGFDDLAVAALGFLQEQAGEAAVVGFAEQRVAELERRYATVVDAAGDDPGARAEALAGVLSQDGFAASARHVSGDGKGRVPGTQLCQGHCPVHSVAAQFPQLCEAETRAFSRLLGVHVQRLATIAHGEHVCTTFVPSPTHPTSAPPPAASGPHYPAPGTQERASTSTDVPTSRKDTP